jgi:hypothetical protein
MPHIEFVPKFDVRPIPVRSEIIRYKYPVYVDSVPVRVHQIGTGTVIEGDGGHKKQLVKINLQIVYNVWTRKRW